MFDSSTLAERLRDVLGAVAFVKSRGIKKIHMAGKGQGAVLAAFAAVLSDDIASVNLIDAPESFDSMARCRVTTWPHALMLRGILKYTDLPDMYDALKSAGKLKNITFVDNIMRTVI
jgi:poly(3-hydroxyalkanoate) synthetase